MIDKLHPKIRPMALDFIAKAKTPTHYEVICNWCGVTMNKRKDAYEREMLQRGHCCCKKCFGNEPAFKDFQSKRMSGSGNTFSGRKHSAKTRAILSKRMIGNIPWNKGKKSTFKKPSKIVEWIQFRELVLQEENCRCYKCSGQFSKSQLHVHHLLSRTREPEYEFDNDNCVTLCSKCHRDFHSKFGVKRFTVGNFVLWMNEGRSDDERFSFN